LSCLSLHIICAPWAQDPGPGPRSDGRTRRADRKDRTGGSDGSDGRIGWMGRIGWTDRMDRTDRTNGSDGRIGWTDRTDGWMGGRTDGSDGRTDGRRSVPEIGPLRSEELSFVRMEAFRAAEMSLEGIGMCTSLVYLLTLGCYFFILVVLSWTNVMGWRMP
jgi:hypothetical protein